MAELFARSGRFVDGSTGVHVTLVGVGTAWTPGTPGSPTFAVTGATVVSQAVVSATEARLVLNVTANAVEIDDPGNSTTATLNSTGYAKRWLPRRR